MPEWTRIYPDTDHRWVMGLRPGNAAEFFSANEGTERALSERARWLQEDPSKYAALLWPQAELALGETTDLANHLGFKGLNVEPSAANSWPRLLELGRTWEADFVWMQPDDSGAHRLIGGVVCFPSAWGLTEKLGQTMSEVHSPVPGLNDTLDRQIETFFSRMVPGVAWTRENANYAAMPDLNQHPSRLRTRLQANQPPDQFWIRLEHQLLLKLPVSGCILFGIRVEVVPLSEVLNDPVAASRLARSVRTMSDEASRYKGLTKSKPGLLKLLSDCRGDL